MKGVCELCLKALAFGVLLPAGASLTGLETDHLVEPGHVGARPSFAWRMETARAGARQVAYRVKVARVARNAASEIVWDSGEVADGRSVGIAYAGTPLESARWYAWTVAVKDEQGRWAESVPRTSPRAFLARTNGMARTGSHRPTARTVCGRVASVARLPIRKESSRRGGASRRRACSKSTRTVGR